jgi:hypothetical protein
LPRLKPWPTVLVPRSAVCGSGREVVGRDGLAGAGAFGEDGDFALDSFSARVDGFGLEGFCALAVDCRGGGRWAEDDSCGTVEDAADGPGVVGIWEEDFALALLFGAVVPAAEEREVVAQEG